MPWLMTVLESSPIAALDRVLLIGGKNFAPEYAAPSANDLEELWGRPVTLRTPYGTAFETAIVDAERTISFLDIPSLTITVPLSVPGEYVQPGTEVFLTEDPAA
ncbi:MAG: hypothetical protein RLY93_15075 [Sumerlaeia bacterium]